MTGLGAFLHEVGRFSVFFGRISRASFRAATHRRSLDPVLGQVWMVTVRSFPTVAFAGIFTGAIIVLQFNDMLAQYDAQTFLGGLNTSAVVREVGPLMISFLLAGKIGAYTAAELGTMRVTEQIEAIECLGTNSIDYIVVPRFLGMAIGSILLLAMGLMISVLGSMIVATLFCGMNPLQYFASVPRFTDVGTVAGGMFRAWVYSTIVASVSCYQGYHATGGARGVGQAVTRAAVHTNVLIVIFNFATGLILEVADSIWRLVP